MEIALQDPIKYLKGKLYRNYPSYIKAVGFKIFYYHAKKEQLHPEIPKNAHRDFKKKLRDFNRLIKSSYNIQEIGERLENVWKLLKDDRELKVIHLKRRNKLETYISLKRVIVSNQWKNIKGQYRQKKDKTINISYEECYTFFQKMKNWEEEFDDFFSNHDIIEVNYEELVDEIEDIMNKIYTFLNVQFELTSSKYHKQSKTQISTILKNYQELKHRFEKTEWGTYFTE